MHSLCFNRLFTLRPSHFRAAPRGATCSELEEPGVRRNIDKSRVHHHDEGPEARTGRGARRGPRGHHQRVGGRQLHRAHRGPADHDRGAPAPALPALRAARRPRQAPLQGPPPARPCCRPRSPCRGPCCGPRKTSSGPPNREAPVRRSTSNGLWHRKNVRAVCTFPSASCSWSGSVFELTSAEAFPFVRKPSPCLCHLDLRLSVDREQVLALARALPTNTPHARPAGPAFRKRVP